MLGNAFKVSYYLNKWKNEAWYIVYVAVKGGL